MAYVRKTESLVMGIRRTVRDMRTKAAQPFRTGDIENGTPEYDALRSVVETVGWKAAPELRSKMPSEWKTNHNEVIVEVSVPNKEVLTQRVKNTSGKMFHMPPNFSSSFYSGQLKINGSDLPPILTAWFDTTDDKKKKYEAITEKFQTLETKLEMFMQQHASLNAALKDMPELELYVPDEFMSKIREPSKKRDKAPTEERPVYESLGLDANELSALAVGHRIATAAE